VCVCVSGAFHVCSRVCERACVYLSGSVRVPSYLYMHARAGGCVRAWHGYVRMCTLYEYVRVCVSVIQSHVLPVNPKSQYLCYITYLRNDPHLYEGIDVPLNCTTQHQARDGVLLEHNRFV
jgi:hypothetical protein